MFDEHTVLVLFTLCLYCSHCACRYSYPFFGVGSYVLFQPPLLLAPTATGSFAESYCVFEFATSMSALMKQLQR